MAVLLEEKLRQIPEKPGIYQMLDADGKIIYIGKSKCLKRRVHSYFVPNPKWDKALRMRPFIADVTCRVTDTHLEAMLLECTLIKTLQPCFNVQFKNDQRYRFLTVETDARKAPLRITQERQEQSFGPLRQRRPLEELVGNLRNLYPIEKARGGYRFAYHVLPQKLDREAFVKNERCLKEILFQLDRMEAFQKKLTAAMQQAARKEQYERAVKFRELLFGFQYLHHGLSRYELFQKQTLLYQVPVEEGVKLFFIYRGMVTDSKLVRENTKEEREKFLLQAKKQETSCLLSEKSRMDYEDILFAELEQAPKEFLETVDLMN